MKEFHFMGCVEIRELLGKKANDEQKLLELIEDVPIDSIYYHTHSYFLRHFYISGPYTNDFANWAAIQARDRVLGERLAFVTPSGNKTLEDIRAELIDVIDHHISVSKSVNFVMRGQPFYFMKSRIIEIPTGIVVSNLNEFINALREVDASAIYNHLFEARLRDRLGRSDFSIWIEDAVGLKGLAEKIETLDSYMYSLEALRGRLLDLCEKEIA
jgi:septum formation topological specificity factor MinE